VVVAQLLGGFACAIEHQLTVKAVGTQVLRLSKQSRNKRGSREKARGVFRFRTNPLFYEERGGKKNVQTVI
jgi:hypothetical protein